MIIYSYSSSGYDGDLVQIELNIFKRSLPGIEIVGLPGGAVKESKVRFRSAILNSGFDFPKGRVIINMAPAGERKEGACFDLPFACRVLGAGLEPIYDDFLILGELTLEGEVRKVTGILAAVSKAYENGINKFIVPKENGDEALLLEEGDVYGVKNLREAYNVLKGDKTNLLQQTSTVQTVEGYEDFSDIMGQESVKRGIEIAVAGGHNLLLFGPPGVGKSLSLSRIPSITPKLTRKESLETTRIWSLAGKLDCDAAMISKPPIRKPHHGASLEGMVGGGRSYLPGEVSLAHNGYLLLDEIAEFKSSIIQSLREPLEDKRVSLNRAAHSTWFPAGFRLIATTNPCPCANLGKKDGICMCSEKEIRRYWKKMGGAIMDRIDIRIPVEPVDTDKILGAKGRGSDDIRESVNKAVEIQRARFFDSEISCNANITPGMIYQYCNVDYELRKVFVDAVKKLSLSTRGCHSVLKIARTIADLDSSRELKKEHILEAFTYRRYGDEDYYFS